MSTAHNEREAQRVALRHASSSLAPNAALPSFPFNNAPLPSTPTTEMPSKKQKSLVEIACKASTDTLATLLPLTFIPASLPSQTYTLSLFSGPSVPPTLRESIWQLYEQNMRSLSEGSSMGWDPAEKRRELWHRDSRFVVLRPLRPAEGKGKEREKERREDVRGGEVAAFTMFRFDWEECADSDWEGEECEVLYCYELQVAPSAQRLGIGKFLLDLLVLLAREYRMRKVMLTCLKANTHALAFYRSMGFVLDPISPRVMPFDSTTYAGRETLDGATELGDDEDQDQERGEEGGGDEEDEDCEAETCDYEILSRRVA